jgi:two-component system, chemotaxis family, chemotaxis protein CheY
MTTTPNHPSGSSTPHTTPRPPPRPTRVLLVGHCVPDSMMLKLVVERAIPGAAVERVNDAETLARSAQQADLLLVNRVLDGEFASESGIGLGRSMGQGAGGRGGSRWMLVSNFEASQAEAEAAGALPGFGKSSAYAEETTRRLRAAVGQASPRA